MSRLRKVLPLKGENYGPAEYLFTLNAPGEAKTIFTMRGEPFVFPERREKGRKNGRIYVEL